MFALATENNVEEIGHFYVVQRVWQYDLKETLNCISVYIFLQEKGLQETTEEDMILIWVSFQIIITSSGGTELTVQSPSLAGPCSYGGCNESLEMPVCRFKSIISKWNTNLKKMTTAVLLKFAVALDIFSYFHQSFHIIGIQFLLDWGESTKESCFSKHRHWILLAPGISIPWIKL